MRLETMLPADTFLRPAQSTSLVRDFCHRVSPNEIPVNVAARRIPGTRAGMCFHNVRRLCETEGGEAEYGWLIWEWEDTYIEAEHHAVWHHDGERFEITPRRPHFAEVLFLPDPVRTFDFAGRRRIDNIRMPLRSDAVVREYLGLAAEAVEIEEANTIGGEVVLNAEQASRLEHVRWKKQMAEAEMVQWSVVRHGRNAACWCGSGRKLKRCCIDHQKRLTQSLLTA